MSARDSRIWSRLQKYSKFDKWYNIMEIIQNYEIIKSKRKTLSLQITKDARLVVRAPMRVSKAQIIDFVDSHAAWIEKHMRRIETEHTKKQEFSFIDGETVYFLGEEKTIRTDAFVRDVLIIDGEMLIPAKIPHEDREKAVSTYLSRQAKLLIPKRAAAFAPRVGAEPEAVTITSARTRWGSCSGNNRVSFSFRLMMMPAAQIDYVVVHELAHILEHNHSDKFYAHIARVLPDYRQRQSGLKEFARKLTF